MTNGSGDHPLVHRVATLDRAGKATLRRSLAFPPGTWPPAFPFVEAFVATAPQRRRTVAYLVAGLMAWSRTEGDGDFGRACARLSAATDSGSLERRFIALLDADTDALPHHLRQLVGLMASKGIAPDWSRLLSDLNWWEDADRRVQQRWARSYYAAAADDDDNEAQITASNDGTTPAASADA